MSMPGDAMQEAGEASGNMLCILLLLLQLLLFLAPSLHAALRPRHPQRAHLLPTPKAGELDGRAEGREGEEGGLQWEGRGLKDSSEV